MSALAPLVAILVAAAIPRVPALPADWDAPTSTTVEIGADGRTYVARELLMGLEIDADRNAVLAAIERAGGRVLGEVSRLRILRVELESSAVTDDRIADFGRIPGVRYAERNGVGEPGGEVIPDDGFFHHQWHLRNTMQISPWYDADVDATEAWTISQGDPNVVLAILDDGIDPVHPEFMGRFVPGYDFVDEDPDGSPAYGLSHGSSCAGLAAANTDNDWAIAGIDWNCRLMSVRVFTGQNGTVFNLVQGLDFCAARKPDVVSMSLINYPAQLSLQTAIKAARDGGCILLAAAGNGGVGNANQSWPGASPNVMSIGATSSNDAWTGYSGTGAALDFVAPGERVVTVWYQNLDLGGEFSGTSAAAPIAAGIVCLMKAKDRSLTHDRAYELLRLGAEDEVGSPNHDVPGRDNYYGWGRLNAWRSLACMTEIPAPRAYGVGSANSSGTPASVLAKGTPRVSFNDFSIEVAHATPGSTARLFFGPEPASSSSTLGTSLVSGPLTLAALAIVGTDGRGYFPVWVSSAMAGETRCYQVGFTDPVTGGAVSNALIVEFGP